MARLVEARGDGRLSAQEARSVERHIHTCRGCRELERDLVRLADVGRRAVDLPAPSPLDRRRGRLEVLREAAAPPVRSPRRPRKALFGAAAALVALTALGVGGWLVKQPRPRQLETGLEPPSIPALEAVNVRVTPEARADYEHDVSFEDGVRIERLRLREGVVTVAIAALNAQQRFLVTTSDAEVEVRGTRFSVEAREGKLRDVSVQEGVVELRRAGDRWRLSGGAARRFPVVKVASPAVDGESGAGAQTGRSGRTVQMVPRRAQDDFSTAMADLEAGNYGKAGDSLRELAADRDDDPRSEDAAFLVVVAMQRAGRYADAARAARDYLDRFPDGARRAEARSIVDAVNGEKAPRDLKAEQPSREEPPEPRDGDIR